MSESPNWFIVLLMDGLMDEGFTRPGIGKGDST